MNISQMIRVRYRIQFDTKWVSYSSFFAGLAAFLLCVFFFGFKNLTELNGGYLFVSLWMPLFICAVYGVLIRGIQAQNTVPYGVMGVLYCIYMVIFAFSGGGQNPVLAVIWYVLTACVLMAAVLGVFPGKALVVIMFLAPVVLGLLTADWAEIAESNYVEMLPKAAALCGLLAFSGLGLCMKPVKSSAKKR